MWLIDVLLYIKLWSDRLVSYSLLVYYHLLLVDNKKNTEWHQPCLCLGHQHQLLRRLSGFLVTNYFPFPSSNLLLYLLILYCYSSWFALISQYTSLSVSLWYVKPLDSSAPHGHMLFTLNLWPFADELFLTTNPFCCSSADTCSCHQELLPLDNTDKNSNRQLHMMSFFLCTSAL